MKNRYSFSSGMPIIMLGRASRGLEDDFISDTTGNMHFQTSNGGLSSFEPGGWTADAVAWRFRGTFDSFQ
jgi:hypothetical protein